MLEDYGSQKTGLTEKIRRVLIFVSVIIIMILGVFLLFYLWQLPSAEQKRALQEIEEKRTFFKEGIQVLVMDAGYKKRIIGYRDLYVPALILEISNVSQETFQDLILSSDFRDDEQTICTGTGMIFKLKPGERRPLLINCSESMFLGTLVKGVDFFQARSDLSYRILVSSQGINFYLSAGVIKYKILPSHIPLP